VGGGRPPKTDWRVWKIMFYLPLFHSVCVCVYACVCVFSNHSWVKQSYSWRQKTSQCNWVVDLTKIEKNQFITRCAFLIVMEIQMEKESAFLKPPLYLQLKTNVCIRYLVKLNSIWKLCLIQSKLTKYDLIFW